MCVMKYLVLEVRKEGGMDANTFPILEDGQKAYEAAKKREINGGVYLCAILK